MSLDYGEMDLVRVILGLDKMRPASLYLAKSITSLLFQYFYAFEGTLYTRLGFGPKYVHSLREKSSTSRLKQVHLLMLHLYEAIRIALQNPDMMELLTSPQFIRQLQSTEYSDLPTIFAMAEFIQTMSIPQEDPGPLQVRLLKYHTCTYKEEFDELQQRLVETMKSAQTHLLRTPQYRADLFDAQQTVQFYIETISKKLATDTLLHPDEFPAAYCLFRWYCPLFASRDLLKSSNLWTDNKHTSRALYTGINYMYRYSVYCKATRVLDQEFILLDRMLKLDQLHWYYQFSRELGFVFSQLLTLLYRIGSVVAFGRYETTDWDFLQHKNRTHCTLVFQQSATLENRFPATFVFTPEVHLELTKLVHS